MNLNSPIREIKGIGVKTEQLFQQLGVYTIGDILLYFPRDYEKYPDLCDVDQVVEGRKNALSSITVCLVGAPKRVYTSFEILWPLMWYNAAVGF